MPPLRLAQKPLISACPGPGLLAEANVNPQTLLATDYLNHFNEYVMLAELVADGALEAEALAEWVPADYESHFARSGFRYAPTVIAAFAALDAGRRLAFEAAALSLTGLILAHRQAPQADLLSAVRAQRDSLAAMIGGKPPDSGPPPDAQAAIDSLFD